MLKIPKIFNFNIQNKLLTLKGKYNFNKNVRCIMSKSLKCQQDWDKRLSCSVLSSLDSGEFFRNLKKASDEKSFISSMDIDILTNKMAHMEYASYDLIEQIVYNFRHSAESRDSLPSTSHAFIRALLDTGDHQRLMRILADKINYGIFLDTFTSVLLLDHFLQADLIDEALQVVIDLMLQEELKEPIIDHLSYLTIHRHLAPQSTITLAAVPTIDSELEEVYRRVRVIENPFYDHHFDLFNDQLKVGKALVVLTTEKDSVVSRGYHVLGLVLLQQFSKAMQVLESYGGKEETNVVCQKHLDQVGSALESLVTREAEVEVKGPGYKRLLHCVPTFTPQQKELYLNQFKEITAKLEGDGKILKEVDMDVYFGKMIASAREKEGGLVQMQSQIYQDWMKKRELMMEKQISTLRVSQEKLQLAEKIMQLKDSEERLSYYEQRVQMSLELSKQPVYPVVKENVAEELYVLPPGERRADRKKK